RATRRSGRFCSAALRVFFIAQPQALQAVPQGGRAQLDAKILGDALLKLSQSQIRFFLDPATQLGIVLFQAGTPIAAALLGLYRAGGQILLPEPLHAPLGNAKKASAL